MRRYKTDYAGAWAGHCNSRQSAIDAAIHHLTHDGYSRCTIIDKETNREVAEVFFEDVKTRKRIVIETVTALRKVWK